MQNRKSSYGSCHRLVNCGRLTKDRTLRGLVVRALSLLTKCVFFSRNNGSLQWSIETVECLHLVSSPSRAVPSCQRSLLNIPHKADWENRTIFLDCLRMPKDQTPSVPSRTDCAGLSQPTKHPSPNHLKLNVKHLFEDFITSQGFKASDMAHRHAACLTCWDKDSCWWP